MAGTYLYVAEGLDLGDDIAAIPDAIRTAAMRAVNKTRDRTRTRAGREMRMQVNFPARYLSGADARLQSTSATRETLEARITGRRRATSLARFARGGRKGKGVRVEVKPGAARFMKRSFLIRLRGGGEGNTGLAIRTSGGKPSAAYKPVRIGEGLYLLAGPSVDQVFRTVADDLTPDAEDYLEAEFLRLLDLGNLI